ncbi:MAG: nuclear transport factor 2 family protein [Acidimicrobiia bacterium]|nr:nuclear transport factor 2 family protein [Acidimicrobiia bacterium]
MDVGARLDRLEAESALRRLGSDYCQGFDKRDWDRFAGVWHEDAVWVVVGAGVQFEGLEAIVEQARRMWEEPELRQSHHHNANSVIDIDIGGDVATGMTDVHVNVELGDHTWQRFTATYIDRYERRAGRWKIARREAGLASELFPVSDPDAHGRDR